MIILFLHQIILEDIIIINYDVSGSIDLVVYFDNPRACSTPKLIILILFPVSGSSGSVVFNNLPPGGLIVRADCTGPGGKRLRSAVVNVQVP